MMKTLKQVGSILRRGANVVPLVREIPADAVTPVAAYLRLARGRSGSFLLESVEGGERTARYSFLGARPFETLRSRGGAARLLRDGEETALEGPPLQAFSRRLARYRALPEPGLPRFCGGAVGTVSYEMAGRLEPSVGFAESGRDEARLQVFDRIVGFDHVRHRMLLVSNVIVEGRASAARAYRAAADALDGMEAALLKEAAVPPMRLGPLSGGGPRPARALGDARFLEGVRRIKARIRAGDIFQAVLSERFELPLKARPFSVYRALRSINPSPYMFFIASPEEAVAGASPEMLVRVEDGRVETRPIAGTRPRGRDDEEDRRLEANLNASVKERAEHLMLVDLGRNDVGRVARPGSVRVASLMQVERYSHVMHLVSSVTGRLRRDRTAWDAFAACFPAGTVSGAPKIRAMQILSGIEPRPRGLYAGAVVYCDFRGNLDSAIAIRSLFIRGGRAAAQAGAGIVADSSPRRELEEVRGKARAVLEAVRLAEASE